MPRKVRSLVCCLEHSNPWQILSCLAPSHIILVNAHLIDGQPTVVVALIDVVEQFVHLGREVGRIGREVKQHHAVIGSDL